MRLHQLHLLHFRNHADTLLGADGCSVALIGRNGAGKTNLLEAMSLLAPGRGFRGTPLREITHSATPDVGWVVSAQLRAGQDSVRIGTALDIASGMDKRVIKIDGQRLKSQGEVCNHVAVVWQTPQMDGLFLEAASARRKYLDRMVYQFDASHAARVASYELAMRERGRLLKAASRDDDWLRVLERRMAEGTAAIASARNMTLERINCTMQGGASAFPVAQLALEGEAEQALLQGMAATDYETQLAATLAQRRFIDAQAGRATRGAHRTQLRVWFGGRNTEAAHCSTGEQKALLLSLLLAQARARVASGLSAPILLLDEVVAHLDEGRRASLFEEISALGAQAFMTGTDAADFSAVMPETVVYHVAAGAVENAATSVLVENR